MNHTEGIIIVGAGIVGLVVTIGLHRNGLRSLVLESSDTLRSAGFTLTLWTNVCSVRRSLLMEALVGELPHGSIRYSSKVIAMEDSDESNLADGSTLKAKVVIGCDDIN
ncbi:hypothetical protein ZIOFF_011450 [Zingiber officinale]|uniref:FAD-binding domain-containing protein n=1 Tax=Zingiber officinale TaxID=94328 RepID=A0A8J5HJ94_ZINOF|nr:hypothetical protein ZIOFF_011450 [Zingiber officinale]